jgi:4-methylaminobutanoate oxidase (formaldehyde-forming)
MTAAAPAPPEELPSRAQIVIIGGGVIGVNIAYHLAQIGVRDVVLLEAHRLTAGTTWHAAGLVTSAGMVDETAMFMARYTRDLYAGLEAETGLATGFRTIGHISLATTPQRLDSLRRDCAFLHGFGVEHREISRDEVKAIWPLANVDDVLAGFYNTDEGRIDPVDVTMSLAKGARMKGARIIEGVRVTGITQANGRVTGVVTERGTIEAETIVNAAGMWGREVGRMAGVDVALQAAEHYYVITERVEGLDRDLPVIEDPDLYGYYRPEGDGILVGLFEPVAAPWQLDEIPRDFAFGELPPDLDRLTPFLETAMTRVPALADVGIRQFFCGPESFTPHIRPMLGPAPGLNSLGILLGGGVGTVIAQWIVDGVPPVDVAHYSVERVTSHEVSRKFRAERAVEQLGVLFGDAAWPTWQPKTGRDIRRSALHERHAEAGAHFGVSAGWEYPEWFAPAGEHPKITLSFDRQPSFEIIGAEHRCVREGVGILDMSLMAKFDVHGPDAAAVLNRLSANDVAREVGRIVYTQWLDKKGGIVADLTITRLAEDRFLVVAGDVIERRVEVMLRRATRDDEHAYATNVTSGSAILSVQGPKSRELLQRLTDSDLSNEAFPYMSARTIHVGYARVLAARVTYVGELGWELHVPTEYAVSLYDAILEAGRDFGVRPIGLAALGSLRLEKGYRDMGVDIDNTDNPFDVGLGFAVAMDKPGGFVGRDALVAIRDAQPRKKRMVQLLATDPSNMLYHNEPLYHGDRWIGYVRAAAYGYTLGGAIGLAGIENPSGVTPDWLKSGGFTAQTPAGRIEVALSLAPLYDPKRDRILA